MFTHSKAGDIFAAVHVIFLSIQWKQKYRNSIVLRSEMNKRKSIVVISLFCDFDYINLLLKSEVIAFWKGIWYFTHELR